MEISNNTLINVLPSLESVIGKLNLNAKEVLSDAFEQKQISTACILQLLPNKKKKGESFSDTLFSLNSIFETHGIIVKYISNQVISYSKSNNLTLEPNPRSVMIEEGLPKSIIRILINKNGFWSGRGKDGSMFNVFDFSEAERLADIFFSNEGKNESSSGFFDNWYCNSMMKHKLLDKETTYKLIEEAQAGNSISKNRIILSNQRLVLHIAKKMYYSISLYGGKESKTIEFNDILQEGNFGLQRAIEKFDVSLNLSFSTYAFWWISQKIHRAMHELGHTIRLPVHIHEKLSKFKKACYAIYNDFDKEINVEEIADKMGISEKDVTNLQKINSSQNPVSLDFSFSKDKDGGNLSLENLLPSTDVILPTVTLDREILRDKLQKCLKENLSEKELQIVSYRFGLNNEKPLTLKEIGDKFGVTRERIRQIQEVIMEKLNATNLAYLAKDFGLKVAMPINIPAKLELKREIGGDVMVLNKSKKFVSVMAVVKTVADFYDMDESLIYVEEHKKEVVKARHIAMYLLYEKYNVSYAVIGSKIGERDHTSVMHACESISELLKTSTILSQEILQIKGILN